MAYKLTQEMCFGDIRADVNLVGLKASDNMIVVGGQ